MRTFFLRHLSAVFTGGFAALRSNRGERNAAVSPVSQSLCAEAEGIDINPYAVGLCQAKGFSVRLLDLKNLDALSQTYDLVTFFDVLNQFSLREIPALLESTAHRLKPGGLILIKEPAFKFLFGRHDRDFGTQVRSGYEIVEEAYLNSLLFLPILVTRKMQNAFDSQPRSDVAPAPKIINHFLLWILKIERRLRLIIKFPFGVSVLILARKGSGARAVNEQQVTRYQDQEKET